MASKISPTAVIKEGLAIFWSRKWTFIGLELLIVIPYVLLGLWLGIDVNPDALEIGTGFIVVTVVSLFTSLLTITGSCHLAVTLQRGDGRVLPGKPLSALGRVFVKGLQLWLVPFVVMLLFMAPVLGWDFFMSPSEVELGWPFFVLTVGCMLVGYVIMVMLFLRMSIMIPAATVGHWIPLLGSLKMVKGHTWRLLGSYILVMIPTAIIGAVLVFTMGINIEQASSEVVSFSPFILIQVLNVLVWVLMVIMLCVWYEKLRLYHEGTSIVEGSPEGEEQSGVGPYADLSAE